MPSLREVSAQSPTIVLDAASSLVQVGVLADPAGPWRWHSSTEESGVALFSCLERLGVAPASVNTWLYCDGPGSILGIRTVAMALRTWAVLWPRPIFSYTSLALVAHALGRPEVGLIADARRDTWHHFSLQGGLRRVDTAALAGELVMPEGFRHWSQPPPHVALVPYLLADLLPQVIDAPLFRATSAPDAFLHEEPRYATWTPQIHRAPGA